MRDEDDDMAFDDDGPSVEELADQAPRTTDSANADAVMREHGRGFLYVTEWEAWIAWDGRRWERTGARARVVHAAMLTARLEHFRTLGRLRDLQEELRQKALEGKKDEDLEAKIKNEARLLKWHEQSQNASRLDACVRLLETRLPVALAQLDHDPWILNVANGTLDLRTCELRSPERDDYVTHLADVEWDDGARCPTWERFVSTAMGGCLDLVLYLQRLVGYALTGLTTEHALAFFYGGGRNGKSTFVGTIRKLLGEYACAAPRDLLFQDKHGQRHPAELARLYGKRLALCAEVGEGVSFDEAKVKDLTGGDVISCRRMREDFWDLVPTHKLFMSGNHKPTVYGDDLGIWRRIRLVPWTVTIADEDVDHDLPSKLAAELPGILRWAAQGCLEWQRIGLAEPPSVLEATREYREESDTLGQFFKERCTFAETERCARADLRLQYEQWCAESGHKPVGAKRIASRLRAKGVTNGKDYSNGKTRDGWRGVGLTHPTEPAYGRASYAWKTEN